MKKIANILAVIGMLAGLVAISPAVSVARPGGMGAAETAMADSPASAHDRRSHRGSHARHRRHRHHR